MSNLSKIKLNEEIMIEVGQRFKKLRKIKGLTQEDLSKRTGVSYGSIKRFEQTGNISFISLIYLARELDELDGIDNLFAISNKLYKNIEVVKWSKK